MVSGDFVGIGAGNTAEGVVYLSGTDSILSSTSEFRVGSQGAGSLFVSDGGQAVSVFSQIGRVSGSHGFASIDGHSSRWLNSDRLYIGDGGSGELIVTNGAMISNSVGRIGAQSSSNGYVRISGNGSQWINSSQLQIGYSGDGEMLVESGGSVESAGGIIGIYSGSGIMGQATITGTDSTWDSDFIYVGYAANSRGELYVNNGALLTSLDTSNSLHGYLLIGTFGGSDGFVEVDNGSVDVLTTHVGSTGNGILQIKNGGMVTNGTGSIGAFAGSTGSVTVSHGSLQRSIWHNRNDLNIGGDETGNQGIGNLALSGNSSVIVGDNTDADYLNSNALIGRPSRVLVGDSNTADGGGQLVIRNGSIVDNCSPLATTYIGLLAQSVGTVLVHGDTTEFRNTSLNVGGHGSGTLDIEAGAFVSSFTGSVGVRSGGLGTVNVSGSGSKWDMESGLKIGDQGFGELNIQNEGRVFSGTGRAGIGGGTGMIEVSGASSQWRVTSNSHIGESGTAMINISNGGYVKNDTAFVGEKVTGNGSVVVTGPGSLWRNDGSLYVGGDATGSQGQGSVEISDGGTVTVGNVLGIWSSGSFDINDGNLEAIAIQIEPGSSFSMRSGQLTAATVFADSFDAAGGVVNVDRFESYTSSGLATFTQNGGVLAPGDSPGSTIIDGDYVLNGGSIEIELAGLLARTEFDFISTTGDFTINGGMLDVSLLGGFTLTDGDEFLFFNIDGTQSGIFDGLSQDSTVGVFGGHRLSINYFAGDGNDIALYATAIPEPSSVFLFAIGVLGLAYRRRRIGCRS